MATVTVLHNPGASATLDDYTPGPFFCELLGNRDNPNHELTKLWHRLQRMELADLSARAKDAERELFLLGITFTVYSDRNAIDRILPFDVIPRVITSSDWKLLDAGIKQRVKALNLFIWDIYHDGHIFNDGTLPADLVFGNPNFRPEMVDYDPPAGTYVHIAGTDIIRDENGRFLVLEDNGRTPSGVSYVVENRHLMQRAFPDLMEGFAIEPVSDYGYRLASKLAEVAPPVLTDAQIVLLSPGVFNSAYFEHIFLAREMGVPLVEGRDLFVEDDRMFMKTVAGPMPVHVIYRRLNDDFLDPEVFNKDSLLGVPGLMRAVRKGNVTLANAVGTGVADDKAVYAYVPRIIRYYLDEDPDSAECRNLYLPRAARPGLYARKSRKAGGEAGRRVGRLWNLRRPESDAGGDRGVPRPAEEEPVQLYRPADDQPFRLPDAGRRRGRAAPCRSAAVCGHGTRDLGAARRVDARRAAERLHCR